jgi:potassium/hydrogen antiporter
LTAARRRRRTAHTPSGIPLRRLIAGELAWVLRQSLHPVKLAVAAVVTVTVLAALSPLTPGLVLPQGWRLALAVILGMTAAVIAHGLLQRAPQSADDDDRLPALRAVLATAALLLAGTIILSLLLAAVTGATAPAGGEALEAGLRVDGPLLLDAGLLTAGVLAAALGSHLRVPGALLFIGIGMAIGDDGLGWVSLADPELVQSLGVVALVIILFEGGLTTDVQQLRRGAAPGLVLATVGVAITTGITAVGAVWLLDMPARTAWLVGAIVASTDAAAVFDLLRRAPLPERLASVLKVESGANDPVAVLLTVGLLSAWQTEPTAYAWLVFGALQLIGGAAVGGAVGWVGAHVMRRVQLGAAGLYPVLGLALAGVSYGTAVAVGASGFLATFVTGFVLAAEVPRRRRALHGFHTALANGVEIGLFLMLGLLVFPSQLPRVALTALGVAAVLALVARPLACAVSLAPMGFSARGIAAISWLGMRGAVPIVLATFAYSSGIGGADTIFNVVFFVVLVSVLVQGTTAVKAIRRLGLDAERSPHDVIAEAWPIERTGIDIVEVVAHEDSALVGQLLRQAPAPDAALVTAIVRGDQILLPRGDTRIHAGDRLVVTTTDQAHGIERIETWARQPDPRPPAR